MLTHLKAVLDYPLVQLSGGTMTAGSLLIAILIAFTFYVIAGLLGRALTRILLRRGVQDGVCFAIEKMVRYAVLLLGLFVALATIGFRLDAILATTTVLAVGIGFGLQNIAQNFVSGIILLIERPVSVGDFVQIGEAYGSVEYIGLRATRVVTRDQVTIIVPNNELVSAQVVNHSVPTPVLRISVDVGVAYGTDTELVRRTLLDVVKGEPGLLDEPAAEVRFNAFGESSLDFSLLVWIANPRDDMKTASRLRFAIDAAFRRAGIAIPFPQRDLHIRSGLEALATASRTLVTPDSSSPA